MVDDGFPHERDIDGHCANCGAGPRENHYKLIREEQEAPVPNETTDLEYREAAMRLAIQHFEMKRDRPTAEQVVTMAKYFEEYLRTGNKTR